MAGDQPAHTGSVRVTQGSPQLLLQQARQPTHRSAKQAPGVVSFRPVGALTHQGRFLGWKGRPIGRQAPPKRPFFPSRPLPAGLESAALPAAWIAAAAFCSRLFELPLSCWRLIVALSRIGRQDGLDLYADLRRLQIEAAMNRKPVLSFAWLLLGVAALTMPFPCGS